MENSALIQEYQILNCRSRCIDEIIASLQLPPLVEADYAQSMSDGIHDLESTIEGLELIEDCKRVTSDGILVFLKAGVINFEHTCDALTCEWVTIQRRIAQIKVVLKPADIATTSIPEYACANTLWETIMSLEYLAEAELEE